MVSWEAWQNVHKANNLPIHSKFKHLSINHVISLPSLNPNFLTFPFLDEVRANNKAALDIKDINYNFFQRGLLQNFVFLVLVLICPHMGAYTHLWESQTVLTLWAQVTYLPCLRIVA